MTWHVGRTLVCSRFKGYSNLRRQIAANIHVLHHSTYSNLRQKPSKQNQLFSQQEAWNEKKIMVNSGQCSKNESFYSLPRVKGNLVPCEEILMGKNSDNPQPSCPLTPLSTSPDAFFDDLARCGSSTVMTTLKEIERTIQSFGKKPSIFGVMDKDILSNQASDCSAIPEAPAAEVSVEESTHWNPASINDLSIQASITDSSYCESTGSAPVDRYVKELKAQIFAEKEMVQKYYDEITNIWNDLRTVSWNDES